VLGKIASIVQQNLGNLSGGVSGLVDTVRNSAQTNAAAAKILNKSPLEISDTSPTQHLKQNPYEYGTVYYPSDVSNLGTGHYMIFDIVMNKHSTFQNSSFSGNKINVNKANKVGENRLETFGKKVGVVGLQDKASRITQIKENGISSDRLTKVSSGISAKNPTHTFVSDSIILYTPPQVKTTYAANYDQAETGMAAGFMGVKSFGDILKAGVGGGGVLGLEALNMVTAIIPGAGDAKAVFTKTTGRAINPNIEMVFKSVPMREFTFTYEFAPRNHKELDSITKIINLFKFHMQPELGLTNFFVVPSEFQITYMYLENRNSYIPKISRCVLKNLELDQSPEGVFTTFAADDKGAAPVLSKMTLTFAETEIMTKQKIAEGF
jgi:hypothetical protein